MDRTEHAGLGVAVIGHVLLFGALSLGLLATPKLPKIASTPVEVTLTNEVALEQASPAPTPAAAVQAPPAPVIAAAPPPPAPASAPVERTPPPVVQKPIAKAEPKAATKPSPKAPAKPTVKPVMKPVTKTVSKPTKVAVAETKPTRRPGLSSSIVSGLSDTPTPSKATKPGKATTAPNASAAQDRSQTSGVSLAQMTGAQKSSLNALIYTQLKPYWKPPSGADAELLITRLSVRLNKDGSLADDPELIDQQGVNDSNRTQAKLHADRAIQAVRRAAPFNLPPQYYDAWKWLRPLKLYVGQPG